MALSVSEANAVSSKYYQKNALFQQVYDDDPFTAILKGKNKIKIDGGTDVNWTVRVSKLEQSNFVDPRAQIPIAGKETRTGATLDWGYAVGSTAIHWDERVKNDGNEAVINLMADKHTELKEDFADNFSNTLWGTDSTYIATIPNIVDSELAYGGIAVADATEWASTEDAATTVLTLFGDGSLTYMRNQASFGKHAPTHHLTTRNLQSKYESLLQPQQRYEGSADQKTLNMGFANVLFFGRPVIASDFISVGDWFGLDMDAFELAVKSGEDADATEWFSLKAQGFPKAMGKFMTSVCNMKCDRRKTSFKFTALDYTL